MNSLTTHVDSIVIGEGGQGNTTWATSLCRAGIYRAAQDMKVFFNSRSGGWSPNGSTRHVSHWMAYCTCPGWLWWWRNWWNEDWQGKPKYSEKTCPSATLSTTNPTWPDPGSNTGRRGGKPATNHLSYGAALSISYYYLRPSSSNAHSLLTTPSAHLLVFKFDTFVLWGFLRCDVNVPYIYVLVKMLNM
jgi:hypothetical protein